MKKNRNMTPGKMHRKIWYLRSTNRPNNKGGATKRSWAAFWKILHDLKLTSKLHHHF